VFRSSRGTRNWIVLAAYVVLTLVLTYPLSIHPGSSVLARVPDTDLFLWTFAWDTHALTSSPWSVFDANIYYPERFTLAYSENLIGDVIFAAPPLWLTGNPVLAMNIVAFASCALCGWGTFRLARAIGISHWGAMLAGLIFAFSPPRFLRIGQPHLASVQWMPFALAYLHTYFNNGEAKDLRLAIGFFSLQALTSGHGAVFTVIAMAGLIVFRLGLGEPLLLTKRLRDVGIAGVLLCIPAALVVLPYLAVQQGVGLRRSLDAWTEWAVPATTFLASPTHAHEFMLSLFSAEHIYQNATAWLFPGYLPLLLAAAAVFISDRRVRHSNQTTPDPFVWIVAIALELAALVTLAIGVLVLVNGPQRWRVGDTVILSVRQPWRVWLTLGLTLLARWSLRRRVPFDVANRARAWQGRAAEWRASATIYYVLLTALGIWLALGPPFSLWPHVYWLPGFSFIRASSRFTVMAMLGLAVLAGIGFDRVVVRAGEPRRRLIALVAGVVLLVEFALIPLSVTRFRVEIPEVDRWLDSRPKPFAIAEVPLADYGGGGAWERRHAEYMLHSMAHWQKTVHGYSGHRPQLHIELYWQLRLFPDEQSLKALEQLGVDYVVVHTELYPEGEWPGIEERLRSFGDRLKFEQEAGTGRVYSLTRSF
jgi:hypothetical protein